MHSIHRIVFFVSVSLVALFCIPVIAAENEKNTIPNPSFEETLTGWSGAWAREGKVISTRHRPKDGVAQSSALEIRMKGNDEWSIQSQTIADAIPGEVWEISLDIKTSGKIRSASKDSRIEISCVSYDRNGNVLDWKCGITHTQSRENWKSLKNRFFVMAGTAQLRFRITGRGEGKWLVDNATLTRIKAAPKASNAPEIITAERGGSSLTLNRSTGIVTFGPAKSKTARPSRNTEIYRFDMTKILPLLTAIRTPSRESFELTLNDLWSDTITASFTLDATGEAVITLTGDSLARMGENFEFPGPLLPNIDQSWVLPINEGLLVPVTDPFFSTWDLELYSGHGLSMPFLGLTNGTDGGLLVIGETQNDAFVRFQAPQNNPDDTAIQPSQFSFFWQPQRQAWGYTRTLRLARTSGGYVGIAKAYRAWAKKDGRVVTLVEKRKTVPQLDKMAGAVNLWFWKNIANWTQDEKAAVEIAKELHPEGIDRVLWSHEQKPQTIQAINNLGWLTGRYDIYQDIWGPENPNPWVYKEGWPDDLVLLPDGTPMLGWVDRSADGTEYPGGVISSARSVELIRKRVPEDLETHPYGARFLDTTTATPLREDWNPLHPLSRSEDRHNKMELLRYLSQDLQLVVGSETGMDMAVPFLHYFEGLTSLGPYRLEDSGYVLGSRKKPHDDFLRFQIGPVYRIPLFQLVYHDCIFSSWYWGDSANRLIEFLPERDLFNALYGTLPLWILEPSRWKYEKKWLLTSWQNVTRVTRQVAYSELLDHQFLCENHSLQYSRFEILNPTKATVEVWVNFSGDQIQVISTKENRKFSLPPRSFLIKNSDGTFTHSEVYNPIAPK